MAGQQMRSTIPAAIFAGALLSFCLGATPAAAKDKEAPETPTLVRQVYACRTIADTTERLACFDRQVAALEQAEQARDVTMFDRAAAQKARRGLFGFTLRDLPFFGDDDDDRDRIERLSTTIKWARRYDMDKLRFEIEDGAVWAQTDQTILVRDPKVGDKVEIYPGSMGSYFAEIAGQKRVRVRRER
jgi:hypothetical protein